MSTPQPLDAINTEVSTYLKQGYNLVGNVSRLRELPADHRPSIEIVEISANPKDRDVYKQKGGGFSLTHQGIKKFANAANVRWLIVEAVPALCDEHRTTYRAVGRCKSLDGSFRESEKAYCFDLVVREEEARLAQRAKARYFMTEKGRKEAPWDFRATNEADAEAWVEKRVTEEMIGFRKNRVSRAQTGAQDRVIRELLQLKDVYAEEDLKHPFVVMKLLFVPDPNRELDRRWMLEAHLGAVASLYPPASHAESAREALPTYPPRDAIPYQDVELTESEQIAAGVPPEETVPTKREGELLDFKALEPAEQTQELQALIKRKGWKGQLHKPLHDWAIEQRLQFLEMLLDLPDMEKGGKPALPWS